MSVVWDDEIKAFVDTVSGRSIAPRLDLDRDRSRDRIVFFFKENRDTEEVRAIYVKARWRWNDKGYWDFPSTKEEIEQVLHDYKPLVKHIEKLDSRDIVNLLIP